MTLALLTRHRRIAVAILQIALILAQTQFLHADGWHAASGMSHATQSGVTLDDHEAQIGAQPVFFRKGAHAVFAPSHGKTGDVPGHIVTPPDCCQVSGLCAAVVPPLASLQPLDLDERAWMAERNARFGEHRRPATPPPEPII